VSVRGKIRQGKGRGNKPFLYSLEDFLYLLLLTKTLVSIVFTLDLAASLVKNLDFGF